jgi:hypothetical protein
MMSAITTVCPWRMRHLGIVMEPDPADAREAGGVLNPAATRGPDGQLYLLPRLVAAGKYSRIGLARVIFNRRGTPVGVERRGVVLEPHAPYELNPDTGGGVEDARITHIAARSLWWGISPGRAQRRAGSIVWAVPHALQITKGDGDDAVRVYTNSEDSSDGRPRSRPGALRDTPDRE